MKKMLVIIAGLLVIVLGGLPWLIGYFSQQAVIQLQQQLQQNPWLQPREQPQTQMGWQQTQINSQWQQLKTAQYLPPTQDYQIESTVEHAAVPFTPLGIQINVKRGEQTLLSNHIALNLTGTGKHQLNVSDYQSPLLQLQNVQLQDSFDWHMEDMTQPQNGRLALLQGRLTGEKIGINSVQQIRLQQLNAPFTVQQTTPQQWQIALAQAQLQQSQLTYTQNQQSVIWDLQQSQWTLTGQKNANLLQGQVQLQGQALHLQPHQVQGKLQLALDIDQVDYQALLTLAEKVQNVKPDAAKWVKALTLATYLPPFLKQKPYARLQNLQWQTNHGDFIASAYLDTRACGQSRKQIDLGFWQRCISSEIEIKINKTLFSTLIQNQDSHAWLKQHLPEWLHNSVRLTGDDYHLYFRLKDGLIAYAP